MGAAYNRELCSIGAFRFAEWNHDDPFYLLWVAGGRDYVGAAARYAVYAELDTFWRATQGRLAIAHGACSGADTLASQRAKRGGAAELAIPAHWGALGRKVAGPMRNRWVATIAKPHGVACVPRGKRNARRYAQGIAARDTMLRAGGRCSIACGVSGAHGARLSPTLVGGGALPRGMAQSECRRRPPPAFFVRPSAMPRANATQSKHQINLDTLPPWAKFFGGLRGVSPITCIWYPAKESKDERRRGCRRIARCDR